MVENTKKMIDEKESHLKEREQKLIEQEKFIRDQQLKNSKIIKINVGGKKFTTTLTTLTADNDSMLAAMFSGRYNLEKDEDGCYFIDRNGKHFSYILDYLRTGSLPGTVENDLLQDLLKEASYYQLTSMLAAIKQALRDPVYEHKSENKDEYIIWLNMDLRGGNHPESKDITKAKLEVDALLEKGYIPCEKIPLYYPEGGKMIIFRKQN